MKNKFYPSLLINWPCRLMLTLAVLIAVSRIASAQPITSYVFVQSPGSYSPISGGTVLTGAPWDNTTYTVAIPGFPFNGSYHTNMYVSTNGFITFGSAPATTEYTPIESNAGYSGAISAFGANVASSNLGAPQIRWEQVGNEIVVQWTDARRQGVNNERISFQIRLNTTNGAINIVYGGTIAPQSSTSNYPQVGLRGATNDFATNVNNRRVETTSGAGSTWANTAPGQNNGSECRFNNQQAGRAPVVGQTYTWTPPCVPPNVVPGSYGPLCANDAPIALNGTPAGGTWSGTGVTGNSFDPAAGTQTITYTVSNPPCTVSATTTIIVNPAPGAPTLNTGTYAICQNGTVPGGQGLSASCSPIPLSTTTPFPGSDFESEGTSLTTRSTLTMPALPPGAIVTAARLKLFNVVAHSGFCCGSHGQRQNIRVALSGAYTLAETQLTTATGPGIVSPDPIITLSAFPAAGGTINLRTRQTANAFAADPDATIGSALIEVDYTLPTVVRWYDAPTSGTLVYTGPLFDPVGQGAVNNADPGSTTFHATCGYNACENIRLAATFTVQAAGNPGTNGSLTICSVDAASDMFAHLGGTPDTGGSWSGPSSVSGGMYDPATMAPGAYLYTVTGTAPCANASATVNVTENTATAWYADLDGDGFGDPGSSQLACSAPANHVADNSDLCPSDINKQAPGQCGCGNPDTDTDGDLTADCNDLCPNDPNKTAPGVCGCGVADITEVYYVDTDGDGFGAGDPVPGYTCIVPGGHVTNNTDLCPDDANKQTPGQCGCGNPDTDTDGDLTADCNDLCPNDPNKIAPGQCGCGNPDTDSDGDSIADCVDTCPLDQNNDQDGDGICGNVDSCPTVYGQNGDICDANPGSGYTLGQLTNCACVPVACSTNLTLEFQTDANPNQITWKIFQQGSNTLVQSGGPMMAPNGVQTENTCLPNGCYYLKVEDAGGDGIANGGYILRTAGSPGIRIIDNRRNFNSGGVSQIAGNEGFCLPMGSTQAIYTSCDKLDWVTGEYYVCGADPAVSAQFGGANAATSGYEFWIYNPNGGYSFRRFRSHTISDGFAPANATRACHMKINNWAAAQQIPANVLMNMRIRTRIAGVNGSWGPACRMMIDPVRAACPLTKLMDIPGNQHYSCNTTRAFATGQYVHARPVSGATQYQFRFRIDAEGFVVIRTVSTYFVQLNWITLPLQNSKTYQVEVRAFKGGQWCVDTQTPAPGPNFTPWGDVCNLTIDNSPMSGGNENMASEGDAAGSAPQLMMYPNPNRGDRINISLGSIDQTVENIGIEIFDLTGKRASTHTIAVQNGRVNSIVELNGELPGGIYLVKVTAGEERLTQRLVIEK